MELSNIISNQFTIIIVEKKLKRVLCIQDMNGDSVPVYYYKKDNTFIISNKLINILDFIAKPKINEKVVNIFIKKGYIPNKETLIYNVCKLIPEYNLFIELDNINIDKLIKKKIKLNKIKNYNVDLYIGVFKKIIEKAEKNKYIFTTLSGGYDSNFIYALLNKNKPIEGFTVGGISGRDETKVVGDNVKDYKNTNLNISYVDNNTLNNYPDLIYKLEGAVYEKGIFLQYALLNSIKNKDKNNVVLISGEGSDEIFSLEYFSKLKYLYRSIKNILIPIKNENWKDEINNINIKGGFLYQFNSKEAIRCIIIKKSGILMNDANIYYLHPYLNRNIIDIAYTNRYKNIKYKTSHIKACKKVINDNILNRIKHMPGSTEPIALFKNFKYIKQIESIVNKSTYNILNIKIRESNNNYLDYMLKILYLEIFEYLFVKNYKDIENKRNYKLEDILKEI